jgi:hypothetical protein
MVYPKDTFWVVDGGAKYIYSESIARQNFKDISLIYPGKKFDPFFVDNPISIRFSYIKNDNLMSVYPVAFPFITALLLQVFEYFGLYIIPLISGILTLIFSYLIAKRLFPDMAYLSLPIIGLATPIFFYSVVFWEHILTAFMITLSFYLMLRFFEKADKKFLIISGALVGLSVWFRAELMGLFGAMFIAYLIFAKQKKAVGYYLVGFLLGAIPHFVIQKMLLGNALGYHISKNLELSKLFADTENFLVELAGEKISIFHDLLFQSVRDRYVSWAVSIPFLIFPFLALFSNTRKKNWILGSFLMLSLFGSLVGLYVKFTSSDPVYETLFLCNFIVGTPFMLFGLMSFKFSSEEESPFFGFVLTTMGLFIIIFSLISPLNGGMQWGSRFLLPFYPIFAILAIYTFIKLWRTQDFRMREFFVTLFIAAVALSFVNEIRGVQLLYDKKVGSEKLIKETEELNSNQIITDVWWYPLDMAGIYFDNLFFYPRKNDGLNDLTLSKLIIDFHEKGIRDFSFVTFTYRYHLYQPFLSNIPIKITEKKKFEADNLKFMDLYLMRYELEPVTEMNRGIYAELCTTIGDFLCREGHYDEGIRYLEKSLIYLPYKNPMPHFLMGQAYIFKEQWEKGLKELRTAYELQPDNKMFKRAWEDALERFEAGLPAEKRGTYDY